MGLGAGTISYLGANFLLLVFVDAAVYTIIFFPPGMIHF